jgi:hypothetical protein
MDLQNKIYVRREGNFYERVVFACDRYHSSGYQPPLSKEKLFNREPENRMSFDNIRSRPIGKHE